MNSKSSKKKRVAKGTIDNLNTIITNLSFIIGRRKWPSEDPIDEINDTYKKLDSFLAGISINLPDVDLIWFETGAKDAFNRLKKRRKTLVSFFIAAAVFISILVTGGAVAAIILIDHWSKYLILLLAVGILFIGSSNFNKFILNPTLIKRDKELPEKFKKECKAIDDFLTQAIALRRKL